MKIIPKSASVELVEDMTVNCKIAVATVPVLLVGMAIQSIHIVPAEIRHHLSNLVDVPVFVSTLTMYTAGKLRETYPKTLTAAATGVGFLYEVYQSTWPNRIFDYADCGCYAAGGIAYLAARKLLLSRRAIRTAVNSL